MYIKMFHTNNACINTCRNLVLHGSRSAVCNSLNYICDKYDICKYDLNVNTQPTSIRNIITANNHISEINVNSVSIINELLIMKNEQNTFFTDIEIEEILEVVCTK